MKKLFLIDGAAGTIKGDLIRFIKQMTTATIVEKYTTRKRRSTDIDIDLDFIEADKVEEVAESCYCYNYGTNTDGLGMAWYGIPKDRIQDALDSYDNVFVVVRDADVIKQISDDYSSKVKIVPVLIYADKLSTIQRLIKSHREEEIPSRLKRMDQVWKDYVEKPIMLQRTVIINDASQEHLALHLNQLIHAADHCPEGVLYVTPNQQVQLLKPLYGFRKNLQNQIKNHPYEKNIFLMMKYRDDATKTYTNTAFSDLIADICTKNGFRCVRADTHEWTHLSEESAYNPIAVSYCCKYGIALIDKAEEGADYNTNVVYELGMMAAFGKQCILLRDESVDKIPFDLVTTIHRTYKCTGENGTIPNETREKIDTVLSSWLKSLPDYEATAESAENNN